MTARLGFLIFISWLLLTAPWILFIPGCGRGKIPPLPTPPPRPELPSEVTQVVGKAQFGSQCPLGFYAASTSVPLELWTCPLGLDPVVLEAPLREMIVQADCKKKTMDIRGTQSGLKATTWEIMPDGSFYLKVDGGTAKLENDGSGHKSCAIPLFTTLWGKVDCTNRDQAVIHLDAAWWLGADPQEQGPTPLPSVSPSPETGPGRSSIAGMFDSNPEAANPNLTPSACNVPSGCFFHSSFQIHQCQ